jgi:hypothetical protein
MERLKAMPENTDRELTVLEKLLIKDPNPKTAMVMAVDMMMAGIDTVTISMEQIPYDILIVAQLIKNISNNLSNLRASRNLITMSSRVNTLHIFTLHSFIVSLNINLTNMHLKSGLCPSSL